MTNKYCKIIKSSGEIKIILKIAELMILFWNNAFFDNFKF